MDRFRKNATAELNKMGEKLSFVMGEWLSQARPANLWMTCATCHHSSRKGPMFCGRYQMVPPVAIIVDATKCESYSDESEIPF
jgi:hypothetical protein